MPRSRSASAAPRAIWSLPQNSASGRVADRRRRAVATASRPQSSDQRPEDSSRSGSREPAARERLAVAVAAQPHRLEPLGAGDVGDALPAELREMLDREPRAAFVVGHERRAHPARPTAR